MKLTAALRNPYLKASNLTDLNDTITAEKEIRNLYKKYGHKISISKKHDAIIKRRLSLLKQDIKHGPTILYKDFYILKSVGGDFARLYSYNGSEIGAFYTTNDAQKYVDDMFYSNQPNR